MNNSDPCGCKQVLEPSATQPFSPCNNQGNPAYTERGTTGIAKGAAFVQVTFATEKVSVDYEFIDLEVENLTDSNPLSIEATPVNKTTNGFKVALDTLPDTGNYTLHWNMYVATV